MLVRRCVVLLSLLLTAWAVPSAHAEPICVRVGGSGDVPDPILAPFCAGYAGPVFCARERVGYGPNGVDVVACAPGL